MDWHGLSIELEGSMVTKMRESRESKILQAYVDRRARLWMQVKIANPTYTLAQVEARLEQLGA